MISKSLRIQDYVVSAYISSIGPSVLEILMASDSKRTQIVLLRARVYCIHSHPRPSFKWLAMLHVLQLWNISVGRFGADPFLLRDIIYAITSFINTDYEYQQVRFLSCATGSSHSFDACIDNSKYALCFYVYIDNSLHASRPRCMHRGLDACIEASRYALMPLCTHASAYTAYALVYSHASVHDEIDALIRDASVSWCIDAMHPMHPIHDLFT